MINAGNALDISITLGEIANSIPKDHTGKASEYMWHQFVAQSSLPDKEKADLFRKGQEFIASGQDRPFQRTWAGLHELATTHRDFLGKELEQTLPFYQSDAGKKFLSVNVPQMRETSARSIPSQSYFQRVAGTTDLNQQLEQVFRQNTGLEQHLRVTGVEETQFQLGNRSQTSRAINAQLSVPGQSKNFHLNLFEPSADGFLGVHGSSSNPITSSGENVYAVGSKFVLDTDASGNFVYTTTKQNTHGFVEFQQGLLAQLRSEIDDVKLQGLSPSQQEKKINHLVSTFNQTIKAQQHYVSSAGEAANLSPLDINKMSKILSQQETVSTVPVFARDKRAFGMGSRSAISKLVDADLTLAVSAGQAGHTIEHVSGDLLHAPKAVHISQAYDHGYYFPEYRERHKALGDIGLVSSMEETYIPGTRIRRHGDLLPGAFSDAPLADELFSPKGVKVVSSWYGRFDSEIGKITDLTHNQSQAIIDFVKKNFADLEPEEQANKIKELTEKTIESFRMSNPDLPDGAMAVKENLFRDMVTSRTGSEKIKITSPGGGDKFFTGETVNALFTGQETLSKTIEHGGEQYKLDYKIKGMKETGGNFGEALEIKDVDAIYDKHGKKIDLDLDSTLKKNLQDKAQQEINTFGLPLKQGEFMGLDAQGRQISAESKSTVQQFIREASVQDEFAHLRMNIVTGPVDTKEGLSTPFQKYVGYGENRGKFSANPFSEQQLIQRFDVPENVDTVFHGSRLARTPERALKSLGGAQLALAKTLGEFAPDTAEKRALEYMINLNPEEFGKMAMGKDNYLKDRGFKELTDPVKEKVVDLAKNNYQVGQSLEKNTANLAISALQQVSTDSDKFREGVEEILTQTYSPYNQAGLGGQGLLSTDTERFIEWGNQARPRKMDSSFVVDNQLNEQELRQAKAARAKEVLKKEVDEIVDQWIGKSTQGDISERVLSSTQKGESLYMLGVRDEGQVLGGGGRGTIEPRYLDSAKASPWLMEKGEHGLSISEEVFRRMTPFEGAIEELGHTLQGTGTPEQRLPISDYKRTDGLLGAKSLGVDIGLTPEQVRDVQHKLPEQYNFTGDVYVPSEEKLSSMGKMQGGRTLETDKPLRKVYSDHLDRLQGLSKEQFDPMAYAEAHKSFENDLKEATRTQMLGQSGGGAHGAFRGPVSGSGLAYGSGVTGYQMEGLGFMDTGVLDKLDEETRKKVLNQRQEFLLRSGEEGMERQVFQSASSVEKTWGDLIRHQEEKILNTTKGSQEEILERQLLGQYQGQLERLRGGGSVIGLLAQDPSINTTTSTPARIYMDFVTPGTHSNDYVSIPQGFGTGTSKGKEFTFQTGIPSDVAGDWDGDTYKVFPFSEHHQERARTRMADPFTIEHKSAQYEVIKKKVAEDMKVKAQNLKIAQQLTPEQLTAPKALRTIEGQGLTAPKVIVPQISKPYELWKAAINRSTLDAESKSVLWNIFGAAEQVPISGRHFADASEYAEKLTADVKKGRTQLLKGADEAEQAAADFFNLIFERADDGTLPTLDMEYEIRGQKKKMSIDLELQKQNLMQVAREAHDDQNFVQAAKVLRSKGDISHLSSDELFGILNEGAKEFRGVHGNQSGLEEVTSRSGSRTAAQSLQSSNQATINAANQVAQSGDDIIKSSRRAAEKLSSPKSFKSLGIAAGGAAALGLGLGFALSPTFTPKKENQINPDFLFPEELDSSHPSVQASGLSTPQAIISQGGYAAQVHLPPNAYSPTNLAGRLGAMVGNTAQAQLSLHDHRMSLSAHKIDKIKNEII